MSKLLNRPLKAFIFYALGVLILSTPVYYLVVENIWFDELDENNIIVRERSKSSLGRLESMGKDTDEMLSLWNTLQPNTNLTPLTGDLPQRDSVFTVRREAQHGDYSELDRFRCLNSLIYIKGKPYLLTVETNVEEADETFVAIAGVTFVFFLVLMTGLILISRQISKKIWTSFYLTLDRLRSFSLSDQQQVQFPETDIEEFQSLHQSLTDLIDENVTAYNQQKKFIENASHELQTPIAVLRSKMDMFFQNLKITADMSKEVDAVNVSLGRISRINKNLLLLAKIENKQFAQEETLDISQILNENIEMLGDYFGAKNLNLELDIVPVLEKQGNKTLLEMVINNLLINSITHSPQEGKVRISLSKSQIVIANSGENPLDGQKIFQRFTHSPDNVSNSGLGLAIVWEACKNKGWQISYVFEEKMHVFSVNF